MNQQNLAIHAILNSVTSTSETYQTSPEAVLEAIATSKLHESPLIRRFRLSIINKALATNIKMAASHYGISSKLV
jgi:hypothetical protein